MNKNRKPATSQARKRQAKAIRKGQKILGKGEKIPRTDTLTPKKALKKYPLKRQKVEKPLMDQVVKGMKIKKNKRETAKHSKRTTPGDVDHRESPPASIHPESTRWKKTIDMQNKVKRKILTAKLQKKKGK